MKVRNITRKTILVGNLKPVSSWLDKTFGMLLGKNASGLMFQTTLGVHSFLMRNTIGVLVLDNNRVILVKKLAPNKIFVWGTKVRQVIELPLKVLEKSKTQIGDRLEF